MNSLAVQPVYLSACLYAQNEGRYLREWLEFHRIVGIERVIFYDNKSTDDTVTVLQPYIEEGFILYEPWPRLWEHLEAYSHCLSKYGGSSYWIAFLDADEFLFPVQSDDLKLELKYYEEFPGICVHWAVFGPNGYEQSPEGLVIEHYPRRPQLEFEFNRNVKSIIQPSKTNSPYNTHVFQHKNEELVVDENRCTVEPTRENYHGAVRNATTHRRFRINHYTTKSMEQARQKIERDKVAGIHDPLVGDHCKDYILIAENIEQHSTDAETDIQRFLPALQQALDLPAEARE